MSSFSITLQSKGGIDKYPAKAHARRVADQLGEPNGLVILTGTSSTLFSHSDQTIPFRQDRYFYYLSGCNEPDCILTYDLAKDWLTLYLPQISWKRFYYDGRGSTAKEAEASYDIDEARYIPHETPESAIEWALLQQDGVQSKFFLISNDCTQSSTITTYKPSIDFDSLRPALDTCRAVKDEHEIKLIRKANEISAAAHKDVLLQLHTCHSEADAEAVYLKRCVASLAKEQSYEPIFGAGENASFLHYIQDDKPFDNRQVLLIDAGCEWQRYASDVTRTIPLNKERPGLWPSLEAKQVYKAVERIQERCIAEMKPGNRFSAVGVLAQNLVIKELRKLGILTGDHKAILLAGTHRAFLPHGLGHHIGLEVHDVAPPLIEGTLQGDEKLCADLLPMPHSHKVTGHDRPTVNEPPMQPGNVITVEPGIYFNKFVLDRFFLHDKKHEQFIDKAVLQRFISVGGVRIEDDILITKHGNENLTTAPKGEEALQIIRQRQRLVRLSTARNRLHNYSIQSGA